MKLTKIALSVAVGLSLAGCGAKDGAYDTIDDLGSKPLEQSTVQDFKNEELWVYVPSTGNAPRYAADMFPFFQGNEKVVKLRFEEDGLKVVQVDRDMTTADGNSRWNDGAPVLIIPGDYKDYRCALDAY
ncbi:MAG: hypothetical protein GY951_03700, partial [Psychromonas sp.]|nr:hypothetical protein [Psychromonas sp.]